MARPLETEVDALRALSHRIGRDPLLVQASTGNTSLKLDGVLWIKASGVWLSAALDPGSFLDLELARVREQTLGCLTLPGALDAPGASVETAMHAVIPERVVLHVHSINAIAWAVRQDGAEQLRARLHGLPWAWIPYVPSGLPLARAVSQALIASPAPRVFVLANHGLVISGSGCADAEELLLEVERRLAIVPRPYAPFDSTLASSLSAQSGFRLPSDDRFHSLATDPVTRALITAGVLYPCQAVFLGGMDASPFHLVEGRGILFDRNITHTQCEVLAGLLEVARRIEPEAPVRYLTAAELDCLLVEDVHRYRRSAEIHAIPPSAPALL